MPEYPEGWTLSVRRIVAEGDEVASEIVVRHGEATFRAASFFELRDGRIVRTTEYWVEEGAEEPSPWRAGWAERT